MKTLLTTTALLAIVAAGPALAQSDTAPTTTEPPAATDQMAPDGMAPDATMDDPAATAPVAPDATAPAIAPDQDLTQTDPLAPAPADTMAATDEVYIGAQASEEDLASNWMGKTLYNGADENLGSINDILIGSNGEIRAVIVGVGGFLGIGQKDVAVNFAAIEPRTDEDGNIELYLNATQEQLENAPDFETLADARARSAAEQPVVDPMMDPAAPAPVQ